MPMAQRHSDCLSRQCEVFQNVLKTKDFTTRVWQLRTLLQVEPAPTQSGAKQFEKGLEMFGAWLGFRTKPSKQSGADSVWWSKPGSRPSDHVVIIFEAKSSEQGRPEDLIDKESLHQLEDWNKQEVDGLGLTGKERIYRSSPESVGTPVCMRVPK